jgi:hypothetical protein
MWDSWWKSYTRVGFCKITSVSPANSHIYQWSHHPKLYVLYTDTVVKNNFKNFTNFTFSVTFLSMPCLPVCLFPPRFLTKTQWAFFPLLKLTTCRASHILGFYRPNIWRGIQVINTFIMQLSTAPRCFLRSRSKYSPQHPVLRHTHSMYYLSFGGKKRTINNFLISHLAPFHSINTYIKCCMPSKCNIFALLEFVQHITTHF